MFTDTEAAAIAADIDTITTALSDTIQSHPFQSTERPLAVIMSAGYLAACEAIHDGATIGEFVRVMRTAWTRAADVHADLPTTAETLVPETLFEIVREDDGCESQIAAPSAMVGAQRFALRSDQLNEFTSDGDEMIVIVSDLETGERTKWCVTAMVDIEWAADQMPLDVNQVDHEAIDQALEGR